MRAKKYDLLAIGDASRLLNLSTSALRNWIVAGELKCVLASDGSRLFTPKQVDEFRQVREKRLASRMRQKTADAPQGKRGA